ncbi:MAG: SpoIID/LytB domain-containing protein [Microcoleaceae cyanobacterium]
MTIVSKTQHLKSKLISTTALFSVVQTLITFSVVVGLTPKPTQALEGSNPTLEIGVVQQLGKNATDTLILKATEGDHLTLEFETPEGKKVLQTLSVTIKLGTQPLPKTQVNEQLVLGNFRSYETAQQQATKLQNQGIEVELAQPDLWQIWAKRDVYNTPLLRRWLLKSLKAQNQQLSSVYLDTQIRKQRRIPYWVLGGYRYNRHELEISSTQQIIQVSRSKDDPQPMLYGGKLKLQPDAYGTYTLVNFVPLETYLRGVVPHEMGAWPPDASIEAQAILSRTYVLRNLQRFKADNYQLCANTDCQVYKGLTEVYPSTDQAVSKTQGQVLTYENELADAVYFSTSGGVTAYFHDIWDGAERPYLKPVIDAFTPVWDLSQNDLANEQRFRQFMALKTGFNEEGWLDFRWKQFNSIQAMAGQLKYYLERKNSPQANFKTLKKVEIVKRSSSGRVLKMIATTDRGAIEIKKDEIQNAFIPPISTLFYIDPVYDPKDKNRQIIKGYVFVGGGFGHGVGFSQTGSYQLSESGWSSEEILNFYFPGTQIQSINEQISVWQPPL